MNIPEEKKDSESGYYYYRARYYDSQSGRFLQKDPHPGNLTVPVSVTNGYAYVGNRPTYHADPSGRSFLTNVMNLVGRYEEIAFRVSTYNLLGNGAYRFLSHLGNPLELYQNLATIALIAVWAITALPAWAMTGEAPSIEYNDGIFLFRGGFMSWARNDGKWMGITPGGIAGFVSADSPEDYREVSQHEIGHAKQSREYGPAFLVVAAINTRKHGGCNWFELEADPNACSRH